MAATCLFSGLNAYELERKSFTEVDEFTQTSTVFSEFERKGVKTHVLWTEEFKHLAYNHSKVFSPKTNITYLKELSAPVTPQRHAFSKVK